VTLALPKESKDLNTLGFELVMPVELNDVDVDRLLPSFIERCVKYGRVSPSRVDPDAYPEHLAALKDSASVIGFDEGNGQAVLDGWLRSSVVKIGSGSRRRLGERMDYVRPLTVAAYRSGLPQSQSRNRRADAVAYAILREEYEKRGSKRPEASISTDVCESLGRGVDIGESPWDNPLYDGTPVDITELLALRFLETFPPNPAEGKSKANALEGFALPGSISDLGADLFGILNVTANGWSTIQTISALKSILAVRLYQLPLRVGIALQQALDGSHINDLVVGADNPVQMYCDFTRRRGGQSDELARLSVARDLELITTSMGNRLLLRSIQQATQLTASHGHVVHLPPEERLPMLADLVSDPEIDMALRMQVMSVETSLDDSDSGREAKQFIQSLRDSGLSGAEQVRRVLVEGLRKRGHENQVKWFWSTGGLNPKGGSHPYALLSGTMVRSTWRYTPAEELISILVSACFYEASGIQAPQLPINELLTRLRRRFGIVIDRPLSDNDSVDARAGAAENLVAFKRQLQHLGCFTSLSDDFSVQYVTPPLGNTVKQ